jgi:hypothetical protein
MNNRQTAIRLIEDAEAELGIDTGIWWAMRAPLTQRLGYDGAHWDFPVIGGTIFIAPHLQGRTLREVVYHEMGHAIAGQYDIALFLGVFTKRKPDVGFWDWRDYMDDGARFEQQGRKTGFVSGYAQTTREEDFCETLSCYLVNGGKTSGVLGYAGEKFTVGRDERLRKKLKRIPEILEACAEAEG